MFPFLDLAGTATSLLGAAFREHQANKQQRMADNIKPVNAVYNISPYAQNQLANASQQYNSRAAGAANAENNIYANQANSLGQVDRNSTSGSQTLAMLAGINGNTNNSFNQLQQGEAQNKQGLLGALGQANQGMTDETGKVYQDNLRNYNNDISSKAALQNASMANHANAMSGFQTAILQGANFASKLGGAKRSGDNAYNSSVDPSVQRECKTNCVKS